MSDDELYDMWNNDPAVYNTLRLAEIFGNEGTGQLADRLLRIISERRTVAPAAPPGVPSA